MPITATRQEVRTSGSPGAWLGREHGEHAAGEQLQVGARLPAVGAALAEQHPRAARVEQRREADRPRRGGAEQRRHVRALVGGGEPLQPCAALRRRRERAALGCQPGARRAAQSRAVGEPVVGQLQLDGHRRVALLELQHEPAGELAVLAPLAGARPVALEHGRLAGAREREAHRQAARRRAEPDRRGEGDPAPAADRRLQRRGVAVEPDLRGQAVVRRGDQPLPRPGGVRMRGRRGNRRERRQQDQRLEQSPLEHVRSNATARLEVAPVYGIERAIATARSRARSPSTRISSPSARSTSSVLPASRCSSKRTSASPL